MSKNIFQSIVAWLRDHASGRQAPRHTSELRLLNQVVAAASATLEPQAVLEITCRELALAFQVPQAAAALLNKEGTASIVVAEYLAEDRPNALGDVIPLQGNPAARYVLEHKKPLAIVDAQGDPRMTSTHNLMRQRGTVSLLILPLIVRGKMMGTIGLDAVERREFSKEEIALAMNAAAAAAQALENAQLFAAERQARRLSDTLSEIARELNAAPDLNAALDLVLSRMERVVQLDSGSILLLEGEQMRVVAVRGFEEPERVLGARLDLNVALLNREVIETRRPLIVGSVADDPRWIKSMETGGLTFDLAAVSSWMGVPLLIQDRVIGMLTADKAEPDFYQSRDAELALAFAGHAAIAIENARLLESERVQLGLAQTLRQVGALLTARMSLDEVFEQIFDLLAQVVTCDSASLQLLNEDGDLVMAAGRGFPDMELARKITHSIAKQTLEERWEKYPLAIIPDTHADDRWIETPGHEYIRSWIGAALRVKGRLIGILNVDSATVNAYDEAMAETVAAFANQAAIAIENTRLHEQARQEIVARKQAEEALQKRTQELGLLYQASRQLGRTLDLEAVYEVLRSLISKSMDCDDLYLSSFDPSDELIRCIAAWHGDQRLDVSQFPPLLLERKGRGIQSVVIQTGEPLLIEDFVARMRSVQTAYYVDRDGSVTDELPYDAAWPRSSILAPMKVEGRVVGIIQVQSDRLNAYTQDDLNTLEAMALQVAAAQANALLYQQAQREIAERIRTEREMAERRMYLEGVLAAAPDAIVTLDAHHRVLEWNPGAEKLFGYSQEEAVGRDVDELITNPDTWEEAVGFTQRIIRNQEDVLPRETVRYRKDGVPVSVIVAGSPIKVDGELIGAVAAYTDITERVRAEKEIRHRAAQQEALNAIIAAAVAADDLQELLETTLDHTLQAMGLEMGAIWVAGQHALHGVPHECGLAIARTAQAAGLDIPGPIAVADWKQEPNDSPLAPLVEPMARFGVQASLTVPILAERQRTGGLSVADEKPRTWLSEEAALLEAVGRQLGAAAERLRLLERIREQIQRIHQIVDTVPEGVLLLSGDLHVILANPAAREYLNILGEAKVGDVLTRLGERPLAELLPPPQDGRWHEITTAGPPARAFEVIARPLATGADEIPLQAQSRGWVIVIRDVTQERETQQRVERQARLAAVGQLAAGIAHDFNNIMAVIVLYSQMSLQIPDLPSTIEERIRTILGQARRATDLTQQILDFGRRSILERRPLELAPFLKEQVKLLERTLPENIRLELMCEPGEYIVHADPTRIQQMVMNLALNARDAMPEGGQLTFKLECLLIEPGQPAGDRPLPEMEAGEWIRITVADTGTGIPQEILPRIYEPFFTTRAPLGTGLGLSQVYGIVRQHGGYVDVDSQIGMGTTFTLYLPTLLDAKPKPRIQEPAIVPHGAGETILVVEDDLVTREALVDSLEALNYRALAAENGREALDICQQNKDPVALVLSDLVMPEMGGIVLFRELEQRCPDIKMVALTGHPLDETESLGIRGVAAWLKKPIDLDELAEALERALGGA